jgi:hypothetical protein
VPVSGRDEIEGLVVCRVGDHRLAFPAAAVGNISAWSEEDLPAPMARAVFRLPTTAGKMLVYGGFSLVVDGLEVVAERVPLLPVPTMLLGTVGGALRGFVSISAALVPLLGLAEFSRFVATFEVGS